MEELRGLTSEELSQKVASLKQQLLDLRMLAAGGKLDKPNRLMLARRSMARIQTVLREKPKVVSASQKKDLDASLKGKSS